MTTPYYADEAVTLYHGDCRDVLPGLVGDAIVTDPPYGETSLEWDSWLTGWPTLCVPVARSMWSFGSLRMFGEHWAEFAAWKLSQDVVWRKHNGSGFHNDRFRRVHELGAHWYRGDWASVHHEAQVSMDATARQVRRKCRPAHTGDIGESSYSSVDGGPRLRTSVIDCRSMHGRAIHPTEKPVAVLADLIQYAVRPGGLVIDPFAGSSSTLLAARLTGRRAIGIEAREDYCAAGAERLATPDLFGAAS